MAWRRCNLAEEVLMEAEQVVVWRILNRVDDVVKGIDKLERPGRVAKAELAQDERDLVRSHLCHVSRELLDQRDALSRLHVQSIVPNRRGSVSRKRTGTGACGGFGS